MRKHLTYANVVSTLALFIVLGGTSIAAIHLGRNAVKSKNIAKNAVTSKKIKDGTVDTADLSAEAHASLRGTKGDAGPQGAAGVSDFALVKSDGTLVRGTAVSARQVGTGDYRVKFGKDISKCAANAGSALFPGADSAGSRVSTSLSIGFDGGADAADTVTISTRSTIDGNGVENTSFSLALVC